MSVNFDGFIGPSYLLDNKYASVERLVNWYLVANEASSEEKKFTYAAFPMPGNAQFCELPVPNPFNFPNRGLIELRGRVFGVNGPTVFELTSAGVFVNVGAVTNDDEPCNMVANGNGQIFIASAGQGYVIPAAAGAGSLISIPILEFLGASYATMQDNYIIVTTPDSNQFQISGDTGTPIGDATLWDATFIQQLSGQADYLRAVISSREYVRFMGARRSQVWQDVGGSGFPFSGYNQTFIETGIGAAFSLTDLGDSLIWIGEDQRGSRACWKDPAFSPKRVSNSAVEQAWQGYETIADAVAFSYIWKGNLLWQVTFPTANRTWVYDVTTSELVQRHIWYERSHMDVNRDLIARPERFHCYAFGLHLVGSCGTDGLPGAIHQYDSGRVT